jgi:osmoprotectant transport system permease protein
MPRNPVLLILVVLGAGAALGLGFINHAPNRLVSGMPIGLAAMGWRAASAAPCALLLGLGPFLPQRRVTHIAMAAAAAGLMLILAGIAGHQAAVMAVDAPPAARTSPGAAFWVLVFCAALALADAMQRLRMPPAGSVLAGAALLAAIGLLIAGGALDQLGPVQEFEQRRAILARAVIRHIALVAAGLAPTILIGIPLGALAARRAAVRALLFPVLNVLQTIPSLALFALLIAPLSALARQFPLLAAQGIGGIGFLPAAIALFLYGLLPVARNAEAGLAGVSRSALEAGRGLGMTPRQIFWRVELPLALPVVLSGVRVAAVQTIGLAAVAALIGAGGLGSIMFQGLFADALDLVLVGVVPIVLLALTADAVFGIVIARWRRLPP